MCVFRDYLAGHDYCCVLVVCWAVGGAPSRARALTARWRGVSRTRTPRWYVADAFRAHCGNASVAPARRHAARWAGPRRACRMGGPPANSWPAPLWAGDARAASGGHLEATGPPAEAHAPRGAVSVLSVPAFRFARVRHDGPCGASDTGAHPAARPRTTAGRGKKAERSARHAATVAVLNRYDAFFAITAAARVLSLDTASPAPLALPRTGVPWTEMGWCDGPAGAASDSRRLCTALSLALCLASRPSQL